MGTCEDVWRLYAPTQVSLQKPSGTWGSLYYLPPKFPYSVPSSTVAAPYLAFTGLVPSLIFSPISPIMLKFQKLYFFLLYCQIIPQSRAWVSCENLLWGSGHSGSLLGWLCIFLSSLLISTIYMGTTRFFTWSLPDSSGSTWNALHPL